MPNIDSSLIPLVSPGTLFVTLTDNPTINVRWLTPNDPHYFDVYNRPMADITLRQLIIAKSLDQLGLRISSRTTFPFLNPPTVNVTTNTISLPLAWLWDMHVTIKDEYENVRLAYIQRFSGDNNVTDLEINGIMRLVFAGNIVGGTSEIGLFYVDYDIGSPLYYQIRSIRPATISEHPNPIPSSEAMSIAGFVVFRTLDVMENVDFFSYLAPPEETGSTATTFISPSIYEITNTPPGGSGNPGDFNFDSVIHGTGILVPSAYNVIPPIGATELTILNALNFPWTQSANLISTDQNTTIPALLFNSFIITGPMGYRSDSEIFPILLTKIRRLDASADSLELTFSTYNTVIGSSSTTLIEFAVCTLNRNMNPGDIVNITPLNNLRNMQDTFSEMFSQNFGSGYATLSSRWQSDPSINAFFDSFITLIAEPPDRFFNAQLNELSIHRTPLNIPTIGEALALSGSTSRRQVPLHPTDDNRYVTELDQGRGDQIDFRTVPGIETNNDIDPIAFRGSLITRSFVLKVNTANNAGFDYTSDILPRIVHLLGRSPLHGDEWFDGTTFKKYDQSSDTWIG